MACIRCRDRKISCDGKSPECSTCVSCGLHCEYTAIRKMRGPGKKKGAKNLEDRVSLLKAQLQRTDVPGDRENKSLNDDELFAVPGAIPETEAGIGMSEDSIGLEARLRQIYPVFIHPENDMRSLQDLKRMGQEDQKSPEGFASLVPQDILRYALENTYDEITGFCPIFDLPTLIRLNDEQQAANSSHPAGNPARWAILSAWIAMGMRLRTAPGSENEFNHVTKSYYRNAVLVLPDLILQSANMETIQALLLMAVFADEMEDHRSFVMLVTNASRQIELLAQRLSGMSDRCERESFQRLLSFARLQDTKAAEKYGLTLILNSVFV
ncbi:hypothetical protein N431DRAFT_418245 [Stipitochalara longipes BDJ]|nr:hypothetical protein N431DRAFT_418245 [Stipitochalara longipes BDJ]